MDPYTYCLETLSQLEAGENESLGSGDPDQIKLVLAHYSREGITPLDFEQTLRLLVESAERTQHSRLAAAARLILSDWQARAAHPQEIRSV